MVQRNKKEKNQIKFRVRRKATHRVDLRERLLSSGVSQES